MWGMCMYVPVCVPEVHFSFPSYSFVCFVSKLSFIYLCVCFFMCVNIFACICVYHVHVWCLQRPEQAFRSPETGIVDGCWLPCGCWEPSKPRSSGRAASILNPWLALLPPQHFSAELTAHCVPSICLSLPTPPALVLVVCNTTPSLLGEIWASVSQMHLCIASALFIHRAFSLALVLPVWKYRFSQLYLGPLNIYIARG